MDFGTKVFLILGMAYLVCWIADQAMAKRQKRYKTPVQVPRHDCKEVRHGQ